MKRYLILRKGDHLPEHVFAGVDANPGDIVLAMADREKFCGATIIDTQTGETVPTHGQNYTGRLRAHDSTKRIAERQRNDLFEKLPRERRGFMNPRK